jgi:hypothetical protein
MTILPTMSLADLTGGADTGDRSGHAQGQGLTEAVMAEFVRTGGRGVAYDAACSRSRWRHTVRTAIAERAPGLFDQAHPDPLGPLRQHAGSDLFELAMFARIVPDVLHRLGHGLGDSAEHGLDGGR